MLGAVGRSTSTTSACSAVGVGPAPTPLATSSGRSPPDSCTRRPTRPAPPAARCRTPADGRAAARRGGGGARREPGRRSGPSTQARNTTAGRRADFPRSRGSAGYSTSVSVAPVIATSSCTSRRTPPPGGPRRPTPRRTGAARGRCTSPPAPGGPAGRRRRSPGRCACGRSRASRGRAPGRRSLAATLPVSTRWAPEVRISTGEPSASNSRLFAIAPTSQPRAAAASAAVCTESGRTTISPVPPLRVERGAEPGDRLVL